MSNERKAIIALVVCLLAGLPVAYLGGKYSNPAKVEERIVEVVKYQDKIVEKIVTVEKEVKGKDRVAYIDRTITKEGEIRERIVEREVTKTVRETAVEANKTETVTAEKTIEKAKIVTNQAQWHLGAKVGLDIDSTIGLTPQVVVGLQGERRIWGPLFGGVWVQRQFKPSWTNGWAAGIAISGEF